MSQQPHENKLQLSLVINTSEHSIDMHHGTTMFSGAADLAARVTDAILKGEVTESRVTSNPIRGELETNFNSSYGQNFSIVVRGEELSSKLNDVGKSTLCEIINFFIMESLFLDASDLSDRAHQIVEGLSISHDDILTALRHPLKNLHKISEAYGYSVKLNHRIAGEEREIVTLTEETAGRLKPMKSEDTEIEYEVAISRYNRLTGNGRLIINGDTETVAFGYSSSIKLVRSAMKKAIAGNLNVNADLDEMHWQYMKITAKKLVLRNNVIVKLLVIGIVND
ncbi:MAG: hypothetical protein JXQ95_13205 [Alteromonas stellipolaris]|uniref:hypothetical protein n=1 Tax=Alteromonas stellipolaris TaxID=233316 RepID=UPI003B8B2277